MFRVVCVNAEGEVSRERFADLVRARGEWRHLQRSPEVVFAGLYERVGGKFRPLAFWRRPGADPWRE